MTKPLDPEVYNKKVLDRLESIDKTVKAIAEHLGVTGRGAPSASNGAARSGGAVADDRDLDGSYGNPTIKYMPREKYWTGQDFTGYKLSETSPEFLDAYAKYLDACAYMASKEDDEKKRKSGEYKAKDASRARGWSKRLRAGHQPTAQAADGGGSDFDEPEGDFGYASGDDDVPFLRPESRWWKP